MLTPSLLWGMFAIPTARHTLMRLGEMAGHHLRAERKAGSYTQFSDHDGNFFALWKGRPIGFLHFEKCGGSALLSWLAREFHPEQINPDTYRDLPPHLYSRLAPDPVAQPLIWGHYDLPTLQRLDPDRAIFTLLREPRARLVSLYQYWRSVDPSMIDPDISFAVGYAHRLSLEDFLNHDDPCLVDNIDNVYVRRLTGFYTTGAAEDRLLTAPQAALQIAQTALNALFFVGFSEEFDCSAAGLAARLGLEPPPPRLRSNITAENYQDPSGWFRKIGGVEVSPAALEALDRRTTLDRELYETARRNAVRK